MKRLLLMAAACILSLLAAMGADIVSVSGEFTFYGSKNDSRAYCERQALNGARVKALASKFGTLVTGNTVQREVMTSRGESTYFSMLNESALKGEWIADEDKPVYTYDLDADGLYVVTCKVRGKAKEISNNTVDFAASVLRNGTTPGNADTRFRAGDDMYLYFKSPVEGYVAVFLIGADNGVYSLLPYANNPKGEVKVKHNKEYVFFDARSGDSDHGEVDEMVMTADDDVEHNMLYVVFSPERFAKAVDNYAGDNLPRVQSYDDFSKWLVKCRRHDSRMSVKTVNLEIHR